MRRGQAAMEFLTTYGWALLMVLVAIGALSFFGVWNVDESERCVTGTPWHCEDWGVRHDAATGDTVLSLKLRYGGPDAVWVYDEQAADPAHRINVSVKGAQVSWSCDLAPDTVPDRVEFRSGRALLVTCTDDGGSLAPYAGEWVALDVTFHWFTRPGFEKRSYLEVRAPVN